MGGSKPKATHTNVIIEPHAQVEVVKPKPVISLSTQQLLDNYQKLFDTAMIKDSWREYAKNSADKLFKNIGVYTVVADRCNNIPPYVVGLIHMLEGSFNFNTHLHNGDLLTARTVNVPRGRPLHGNPPFDWRESAIDALHTDRVNNVKEWNLPNILNFLESFNGTGYRRKGINSPYIWSGTQHYTKGKFVADGVYNSEAVSKQLGAATCMLAMRHKGYIVI